MLTVTSESFNTDRLIHSLLPAAPFSILAFFAGCAAMAIVETAGTSTVQSSPYRYFSRTVGLRLRQ